MSEEEIIKYLKTIEEELQEENLSSFILNKDNVKYYTETLNLIDKLQKELDNSISKDIIRNFIKEELPDDEIMECCENFDENGVYLRKKLEELLGE